MQSRIAQYEKADGTGDRRKEGLLQDIEQTEKLHVQPLVYRKNVLSLPEICVPVIRVAAM